ncbi:mitochondrial 54S ribosomal protein uL2m [Calcarisporiella thermophila]|uniref:mitochondrial 54S ribosomal protein uL2m n=1 Tax=Calcarisporiella thermophila TaxID=911321 RepID=UPI0037429BB8
MFSSTMLRLALARTPFSLIHSPLPRLLGSVRLAQPIKAIAPPLRPLFPSQTPAFGLPKFYATDRGQFKTKKPTTPSKRWLRRARRDHLWKGKPIRKLTVALRKTGGRNHHGRITVRHRGGGHRRRLRLIDWRRHTPGPHEIVRLEYDPNRTAHLALLRHKENGGLSYILAPHGSKPGDVVESYCGASQTRDVTRVSFERGNCMPLRMIPVGSIVHCIGLRPHGPAVMVRSAGTSAQVVQTGEKGHALVRLCSGEVRRVPVDACATLGVVSNPDHQHESLGKAGRKRWMGIRPTVRGVAQNSVDHPHGGGRGKSKSNKHPRSPWGWLTKGKKTRTTPNKMVVRPRNR